LPWDCGLCGHTYIDQDEVARAVDTRVNQPLRYCYILAPESVLHIPVVSARTNSFNMDNKNLR
jgi:hypothetical protein